MIIPLALCVSCATPGAGPAGKTPAATISGTVRTDTGEAIDAAVLLGGTSLHTRTDSQGRFALAGASPGWYRLVVETTSGRRVLPCRVEMGTNLELGEIRMEGAVHRARVAEPVKAAATLEGAARETGIDFVTLSELAAEAGFTPESWNQFLATGAMPASAAGELSRKDLLRLANSARAKLSGEEAAALLGSLTGLRPEKLSAWIDAHRAELHLEGATNFSRDQLGRIFSTVRRTGRLDDQLLALVQASSDAPSPAPGAAGSDETVLYDGALGGVPEDQGWWYLMDPLDASATQEVVGLGVELDTSGRREDKAGYFSEDPVAGELLRHPRLPRLDAKDGFTLNFRIRVEDEQHLRQDRAGVSLILICADLRGIELGFWGHRVWAQADDGKPIFQDSRAETAACDSSSATRAYALRVRGARYALEEDGALVLEGPLRDYRPFGGFPYTTPNFLFLGDDTTSAQARFRLERVALVSGEAAGQVEEETAELEARDAARYLAQATGLTPMDALRWLEAHHDELSRGPTGNISAAGLAEAAQRMGAGVSQPSGPAFGGGPAFGLHVEGGGGGGGQSQRGGEADGGEGDTMYLDPVVPRVKEFTPATPGLGTPMEPSPAASLEAAMTDVSKGNPVETAGP